MNNKPIFDGLLGQDERGPFLQGAQCSCCEAVALGMRDVCPACWSRQKMTLRPIGRSGKLYTYTVIHQAPPGFPSPIAVGYVDVEHDVRVFAHIAKDDASLKIGAQLQLTEAKLAAGPDGAALVGPLYLAR